MQQPAIQKGLNVVSLEKNTGDGADRTFRYVSVIVQPPDESNLSSKFCANLACRLFTAGVAKELTVAEQSACIHLYKLPGLKKVCIGMHAVRDKRFYRCEPLGK